MGKASFFLLVVMAVIGISAQTFAKEKHAGKAIAATTPIQPVSMNLVSNAMTPDQYSAYLKNKFNVSTPTPSVAVSKP